MQTTTNRIPLLRSISRRQQIAAGCSYREVLNPSVYRHLVHEVTRPAVNFTELLTATDFICSFPMSFQRINNQEMHI